MTMERREVEILETRELDDGAMEISGILVPYGERATIGPGIQEEFVRGSLVHEDTIPLRDEHRSTIGRSLELSDSDDGMLGSFRISDTGPGREAYTLARDGAYRKLSIGFVPIKTRRDGDVLVRESARLVEVSLVGVPAYAGAAVTEVRSDSEGDNMEPDNTTQDDAVEARELLTEARALAQAVIDAKAPTIEATHRGHEYRSIGEVVRDTIQHARRKDPAASERLTMLIDEGVVDPAGSSIEIREFANVGNSVGGGVAYDAYVPALLELLREGRPTADLFQSSPGLPSDGNKVFFPSVSVGNTVAFQDGQGTGLSNTAQEQILTDWFKSTIGGGQGVTIQAQMWTNPGYLQSVVADLIAAHNEFLDWATINGDPAVETPVSGTGYVGILAAGATDVPVGGDAAAALGLFGSAWAAVYNGSKRSPIAAIMQSDVWGQFLDLVDTDGRPLVTTDAPSNPAGIGNPASIAGTIRSIPVVLDDSAPAGSVIVSSFRDAHLLEDGAQPVQISLTYPDVLVTDVSVYSFSALAIRRPAAFAVLSGITA